MPLILVIISLIVASSAHAQGARTIGDLISGPGLVVDGDTFDIGSERIRIWGIDAPEGKASCYRDGQRWRPAADSASELRECLKGTMVTCRVQKIQRRWERLRFVSECWRNDSKQDIAECMVRSGWATDYPGYSGRHYERWEAEPKARRTGLWQCDGPLPTERWCKDGDSVPCERIYKPSGPSH